MNVPRHLCHGEARLEEWRHDAGPHQEARIDLRHVSDAVLYMAGLPLDASVPFMTLMATNMPLIGRG